MNSKLVIESSEFFISGDFTITPISGITKVNCQPITKTLQIQSSLTFIQTISDVKENICEINYQDCLIFTVQFDVSFIQQQTRNKNVLIHASGNNLKFLISLMKNIHKLNNHDFSLLNADQMTPITKFTVSDSSLTNQYFILEKFQQNIDVIISTHQLEFPAPLIYVSLDLHKALDLSPKVLHATSLNQMNFSFQFYDQFEEVKMENMSIFVDKLTAELFNKVQYEKRIDILRVMIKEKTFEIYTNNIYKGYCIVKGIIQQCDGWKILSDQQNIEDGSQLRFFHI